MSTETPTDAPTPDRAKAARPLPKPGIMDIHAYVPGKAQAAGTKMRRRGSRKRWQQFNRRRSA